MNETEKIPTLEEIRERLKHHNLASVAKDSGIHKNTLYRLMSGGVPNYETGRLLVEWMKKNAK